MFFFQNISVIESQLVSFERCRLLLDIPQEREQYILKDHEQDWVSRGAISFENFSVRYREDTEIVLKNLDF